METQVGPETAGGPEAEDSRVCLAGIQLDALTLPQTVRCIMKGLAKGVGGWVITANLDHFRRARVDASYTEMLAQADIVVADGMPLIWASRLQGSPLPERVAGSSLVLPLAAQANEEGRSLFLLGGNPGVAEEAAAVLCRRHPGLEIAGTLCPPMGFEDDPAEMAKIRDALAQAEPDLVYVALGSPKQERLIQVLKGDFPKIWWLGIGISLSFLTGEVQRAPSWMQRCGLEWCHRLVQEPRRLAKRYLVHGLPFACRLGFAAVVKRLTGSAR